MKTSMKRYMVIAAIMGGLAVAGCSSKGTKDNAAGHGKGTGLTTGPGTGADNGTGREFGGAGMDISQHVVYFDFDSSELKPEAQPVLNNWSKYLSQNPSVRVRLEGNTDERGTREYNVALGERRARAVQQALQLRGVSAGQLNVVSYGEERPAAQGHDESAWSQNRRVEIAK